MAVSNRVREIDLRGSAEKFERTLWQTGESKQTRDEGCPKYAAPRYGDCIQGCKGVKAIGSH